MPSGTAGAFQRQRDLGVCRRLTSHSAGRIFRRPISNRRKTQRQSTLHRNTYPQRLEDRIRQTSANRENRALTAHRACGGRIEVTSPNSTIQKASLVYCISNECAF